jgi:hypothetical protein
MAQNTTLTIQPATWTLITDSDVSAAMWVNVGSDTVWIKATTDTTTPTTKLSAVPYAPGTGERASVSLADIWPGLTGRNRLWAFCDTLGQVTISHA